MLLRPPSYPQPTCLVELKQIRSIRCLLLEEGQAVLQLGIEGAPQSLSIKTSSLAEAENMADLIDGYCRLQGEHKGSLIIHPKKDGEKWNSMPQIPTLVLSSMFPPGDILGGLLLSPIPGPGLAPACCSQVGCFCYWAVGEGDQSSGGALQALCSLPPALSPPGETWRQGGPTSQKAAA
ncbi:protein-tyrosine kinase 2-beta-like [Urocitellus parryii]